MSRQQSVLQLLCVVARFEDCRGPPSPGRAIGSSTASVADGVTCCVVFACIGQPATGGRQEAGQELSTAYHRTSTFACLTRDIYSLTIRRRVLPGHCSGGGSMTAGPGD